MPFLMFWILTTTSLDTVWVSTVPLNSKNFKLIGWDSHSLNGGVIIECPLNDLFHDIVIIILTSQTAVRELDNDDDDDEWPLVVD